jgi:hypothetical protein
MLGSVPPPTDSLSLAANTAGGYADRPVAGRRQRFLVERALPMGLRFAAAACFFLSAGSTSAQGVFKFQLNAGDKLQYRSQFEYRVETKAEGGTQISSSKLGQIREWRVVAVDKLGVATMELTVLRMTLDRTDPDGKKLLFDSASKETSDEQLWKQLSKAVGQPILRVQMAANGVLKESKNLGEVKSVFHELPFQVTVPDEYPRKGLKWQREFAISAEAMLGKGDAFKALQVCEVEQATEDKMVVRSRTQFEKAPTDVSAKIALAQFAPTGTVTLDMGRGLMLESDMSVRAEAPDFDGPGTNYLYISRSVEKLMDKRLEAANKE